jgi:hypothetical protein
MKGDACSQWDDVVERSQILGRVMAVEDPVYIPLTGVWARWIGRLLNRYYWKLIKLKMAVHRFPGVMLFDGKA